MRGRDGIAKVATWRDALLAVRDLLNAAGRRDPASVRFLVSAHASLEELYLTKRIAEELKGPAGAGHVTVSWRRSAKAQPATTTFPVPPTDAPNVLGARDLGLAVGPALDGPADLSTLRSAVDAGHVEVLYVVDPGPAESIGEVGWVVEARQAGRLKALVYQGVLAGPLANAADVVLPGAAWVEKDGCFTNDQGMVQAASKALVTPGEAVEDWQILTSVAAALGLAVQLRDRRRGPRRPGGGAGRAAGVCRGGGADLQSPGQRRDLAAVVRIPPNAGSGTSCTRICRR